MKIVVVVKGIMSFEGVILTKGNRFGGEGDMVLGLPQDMENGTKFVKISVYSSDSKIIPFIVETPVCTTSGIKKSSEHGTTLCRLPIALCRKRSGLVCPTDEQRFFADMIGNAIAIGRKWLVENSESVGLPEVGYDYDSISEEFLSVLEREWRTRPDKDDVPDSNDDGYEAAVHKFYAMINENERKNSPVLHLDLHTCPDSGEITTPFFEYFGKDPFCAGLMIDPLDYINPRANGAKRRSGRSPGRGLLNLLYAF